MLDGEIDIGIATDTLDDNPKLITFPFRSWEHAVIVPKGHKLERVERLTLESVAEWPIVISALDADVIKAYVELGLGIGIIASLAFDAKRDAGLRKLDCSHLFAKSTSRLAVRRGRYLRRYVYGFIALCSPDLTEKVVRAALHPRPSLVSASK